MKVKSTIPIFDDLEGENLIYTFACFSQGGKSGAVQKCSACRGRGVRIMIRQLAPGMVQQMQSVCSDCNGEGMHASVSLPFCWGGLGMQKLERLTFFLFQRVFIFIIL